MSSRCPQPQQNNSSETCLQRRRFLRYGVAAAGMLIAPQATASTIAGNSKSELDLPERKLSLLNLHTGENLSTTYWAEGEYLPGELAAINKVLRDHRTGDIKQMDTELLDLLHTLHQKMDSNEPFNVISGYRSPKTNAMLNSKSNGVAKKSMHMQGRAIDIRLPGNQLSDLRKAAISCQGGGVGYYPRSDFIHVDTGRVRRWG